MQKMPLAHILPALAAMLSVVAALSRSGFFGFSSRARFEH
jgi:hypothetical protein